ncbi:FAD:protein FMN transferase [Cardiobacteriaceae bacterium TAE3-ERU3]|nr:FAD:protein FMN transferase [Cardiobacteriaceae bacterium TAE3-ERU3]
MNELVRLQGQTMGSPWQIQIAHTIAKDDQKVIRDSVELLLRMINGRMSLHQETSEICAFNAYRGTDIILISPEMRYVVSKALTICAETDGVYDITIAPLVDIWGFGAHQISHYPEHDAVTAALQKVGYHYLHLNERGLSKDNPEVSIDLSSIAKGYGVDKLAQLIEQFGYHNYMVDIGGEIRLSGDCYGQPWKVAIEYPQWDGGTFNEVMAFSGISRAVATSGSYRNYSRLDNGFAAHEIDAKTGYTKASHLLSVTVLADDCMSADGYATALYLLGDDARSFAEQNRIAAVLMIEDEKQAQGYRLEITTSLQKMLS